MKTSQFLAVLVLVSVCGVAIAVIKPAVPFRDLHPVDACLFGCNMCFEDEYLLDCANKVCLTDLPANKPLGKFWSKMCPGLHGFFKK